MTRISRIVFFLMIVASPSVWAVGHTGKVLETMNSGGYTYALVNEGEQKFWIAAPQTQLKVGQTISFREEMWMPGFTSKTLHRTFDNLLFAGRIIPGSTLPPSGRRPEQNANPASAAKPAEPVPPLTAEDLSKAGTYTITELFAKKSELKGKPVHVRGKVAKVSNAIMGTNWVHVQDGTGKPGSNDVIFRSKTDSAAVGDKVDATGVLVVDQDFGFGYQYPVLVEQAVIKAAK